MMRRSRPGARPGFTLVEAMVVVLVMGTLFAIGKGLYKRAIDSTRAANHRAAVAALTTTLESYAGEHDSHVPKAPYKDKAFNANDIGLGDYITQGAMPPNPYPNTGAGHDDVKITRGTFFWATDDTVTWVSRPAGGVGSLDTGNWPKLGDTTAAGKMPDAGRVTEVPMNTSTDMTGAVMYESDGSSYVMYGLGGIVPRPGSSGSYHMLTGVRTNMQDKVQNQ